MDQQKDERIVIRPSTLSTFVNCRWSWYKNHVLGHKQPYGARAAVGTAIHAAADSMWKKAIASGSKDLEDSSYNDIALHSWRQILDQEGVVYDEDDNAASCENRILSGVEVFMKEVAPSTDIPLRSEETLEMDVKELGHENHPIVKAVKGTVDYIAPGTIADIKTSKRKIAPQSYDLQQSVYRMLAEHNGYVVQRNLIQGVVFTKNPYGSIDTVYTNVRRVKYIINNLLMTLRFLDNGTPPEILFGGNPKYYLCSDKYCGYHGSCPFVHG